MLADAPDGVSELSDGNFLCVRMPVVTSRTNNGVIIGRQNVPDLVVPGSVNGSENLRLACAHRDQYV